MSRPERHPAPPPIVDALVALGFRVLFDARTGAVVVANLPARSAVFAQFDGERWAGPALLWRPLVGPALWAALAMFEDEAGEEAEPMKEAA